MAGVINKANSTIVTLPKVDATRDRNYVCDCCNNNWKVLFYYLNETLQYEYKKCGCLWSCNSDIFHGLIIILVCERKKIEKKLFNLWNTYQLSCSNNKNVSWTSILSYYFFFWQNHLQNQIFWQHEKPVFLRVFFP